MVSPLNGQSAISMMQSILKDNKHVLTQNQWQIVKERVSGTSVCPLYVKLLSSLAKKWTSSKTLTNTDVPLTIEEIVNIFLLDLERKFGVETLRKICTYLTCTNFGLREAEIVELLASPEYEGPQIDNEVDNKKIEFSPTEWLEIKKGLSKYYSIPIFVSNSLSLNSFFSM